MWWWKPHWVERGMLYLLVLRHPNQYMSKSWGGEYRDTYLVSLSRTLYIGSRRHLCGNGVIMGQHLPITSTYLAIYFLLYKPTCMDSSNWETDSHAPPTKKNYSEEMTKKNYLSRYILSAPATSHPPTPLSSLMSSLCLSPHISRGCYSLETSHLWLLLSL